MEKIIQLFNKQNNTGTVFRNTFYLTLSEFFLKAIGLLWIMYLARSVSVLEYGTYNYVTSLIAIFSFLPDFGVGLIVIREIARNPKKSPEYLGNSFTLNASFSLITFIIIIIFSLFSSLSKEIFYYVFIASITLVLSTVRSVAIFYFDGKEKMHVSAFLNSLNSLLLIVCASTGVFFGFKLTGVFYGMLFATCLSLIVSWKILLSEVTPKIMWDVKTQKYYLLQGLPLGLAAFSALIYTHVDVLILGKFLGQANVGIYSSATPFAFALIQLLNVPFVVAVYPALARIENNDKKRFLNAIIKSIAVILIWSVPSAILVSICSPYLIPLIFGNKYDQGIKLLQLLIFFVPALSLSAFLYKVLIILKKQKIYLYISIFAALLNIFLNFTLIPFFGIYGAVYSAILTQYILLCIYILTVFWYLKRM